MAPQELPRQWAVGTHAGVTGDRDGKDIKSHGKGFCFVLALTSNAYCTVLYSWFLSIKWHHSRLWFSTKPKDPTNFSSVPLSPFISELAELIVRFDTVKCSGKAVILVSCILLELYGCQGLSMHNCNIFTSIITL